MSPILHVIASNVGGILAGLALAGAVLWRQQRALKEARYQANHDEVTGLPNRRRFLTCLHETLAADAPVGVVLLDLDRFKAVNDTLGHEAGNDLLHQIGRRLASLPKPVKIAARLSGDEFALLVRGGREDTDAAAHAAWQVISSHTIQVTNGDLRVVASVGYAHTGRRHASVRDLLTEADQAMYRAKKSGTGVHGSHGMVPAGPRSRSRHDH
ncbi:GGDEF domain-containing protein [Micromonospora craterilacus]|uniref:GGDEF domain-containing protein n=1 Tax=Micromonospora craterilacus TaxID=1655439 RepID=A0A2W2DX46_9ACTN|nr:GGDEF domain-containing protein [Micromonospora craterilacus]PZG09665.1 GGDEF domain-containing protein [Micromonospora craterilacus]